MGGWTRRSLDDVCHRITDGSHNPPRGISSSDHLMLSSKNVLNGRITLCNPKFLTLADFESENRRTRVRTGCVLLTIVGTVGRVAVVDDSLPPITLQRSVAVLDPDKEILLPRFLMYLLQAHVTSIDEGARGVAQKGIYLRTLRQFEFPIAPLPEQERIVAILDEAFAAIATAAENAEKNIASARELFENQLDAMVSGAGVSASTVSLAELATDITDGDHQPPPKSADGIPFITISNIDKRTHTIDFSDAFRVPEAYYSKLKPNRKPRRGDILYTVTGSFGIPVVVDTERDFCFQRHIGLIRPAADVLTRWLYYVLLTKDVRTQAEAAATGTAQKTVSLGALRKFRIHRPPLADQHRIVALLDALAESTSGLASLYERKSGAIAELKQSILHKAFTGELTVDFNAADVALSKGDV